MTYSWYEYEYTITQFDCHVLAVREALHSISSSNKHKFWTAPDSSFIGSTSFHDPNSVPGTAGLHVGSSRPALHLAMAPWSGQLNHPWLRQKICRLSERLMLLQDSLQTPWVTSPLSIRILGENTDGIL